MVVEIIGKARQLKKAFTLMSGRLGDKQLLFNPIVITATPDLIMSSSVNKGRSVFGMGTFRNFAVKMDEESMQIPVNVNKLIQYLSLADSDEEVSLSYDGKTFELRTHADVCSIPGIKINLVSTYIEKPPFQIKEGIAHYKKGTVAPTTKIEMNVLILKQLMERAQLTKTDYYPLEFTPPNTFLARCGDEMDRTTDSIRTERNDVIVEGEACRVILSVGFEEVFSILEGTISLHCKSQYPVWVTKETPDYTVHYNIAPRREK